MLLAGVCAPLPELATPLVSPLPSSAVPLPLAFLLLDSVPALAGCLRIRRVGLSRSGALGGAEKRACCQGKRHDQYFLLPSFHFFTPDGYWAARFGSPAR